MPKRKSEELKEENKRIHKNSVDFYKKRREKRGGRVNGLE